MITLPDSAFERGPSTDINGFSLLDRMCSILAQRREDSDYAIARYLVERMGDMAELSVAEIVRDAFVTRSAVRRFCNRMGFSSFSTLAASIGEAVWPSDIAHRDLDQPLEQYWSALDLGIKAMFEELRHAVSKERLLELAQTIHDCDDVVLACANNTNGILRRFQQELLFARKLVSVTAGSYAGVGRAKSGESDLLLVVSASGVFARGAACWARTAAADCRLVTASCDEDLASSYGAVYCLSCGHVGFDDLGIFGKYGISYFFDLLSACYLNLFGSVSRVL